MTPADEVGIDVLRSLWAEAERRMYPLATVTPERYEQVIRLAREVADDLSGATTPAQLVARWSEGPAMVLAASDRAGLPLGDLPEADVAGVAFALRDHEVRAAEHQRELEAAIAAARSAGDEWALIHEKGDLEHGLMDPYQAIELHLRTGAAIVSSVEPNPVDGKTNHVLTVIRLDPATGAPVDLDPAIAKTQEYSQLDEFVAARATLLTIVEGA